MATSLDEWELQSRSEGVDVPDGAYGPGRMVPLLRDDNEADLLARLRQGDPFPLGPGQRWLCLPVGELHETNDAHFWRRATDGVPLWKGESFDQFLPSGAEARVCPLTEALLRKIRKPRPGGDSLVAKLAPVEARRAAVLRELDRSRVAFRDVSRATDSRTVRACLVPKGVLLTNTGPYLAFVTGGPLEQAACLAVMNSIAFDWQARRFVETHLNFFILEGLRVPSFDDVGFGAISEAAARCHVDDRFADFAAEMGIEPLDKEGDERERLRVEIDAQVAQAWQLTSDDLELMFHDFTFDAVPAGYRERLLARLAEL